jgi:hypothetical protein
VACWGSRLGVAHRHRDALPRVSASVPAGAEQGRREERGREREKGWDSNKIFSKF